ncbi:hypothetical protein NITHO_4800004 [Nitrolancea hollandica Lb]|uniref:Uncharacterized protein n=1 Tax=Nitrolancea hollandica Lb TaxID=1129897 RepID=I4EKV6_9BACT|nr:hypothetical protein NITHO_4800004 [Nitrolancea hollandica Lb]
MIVDQDYLLVISLYLFDIIIYQSRKDNILNRKSVYGTPVGIVFRALECPYIAFVHQ